MQQRAFYMKSEPAPRSCAVFSSPHSGADYPEDFLNGSSLTPQQLRSSEDAFVDRFVGDTLGAPVLCARFPRAYVDLNRAPDELDPALIKGASGAPTNPRIAAGLGVIPRVVADGRAIRVGKMPQAEAVARLNRYYHPYHNALREMIAEQKRRFGTCTLFDLHSMPRSVLPNGPFSGKVEVILGDRYGTSCDPWLGAAVAAIFKEAGFKVARNAPFAGGFITRHYGAPRNGVNALQIEIDRSLYMDEKRIEPRADFEAFQELMRGIVTKLAALPPCVQDLAAE